MINKFSFKVVVSVLISFLLCSFTNNSKSTNSSQTKFDSELKKIDENLDENYVLGSKHNEVVNQLSENDYKTIKEFIKVENNHIKLDEKIYTIMPINDYGLSIDKYKEKTGLEYQDEKAEYISNYKTLKFVYDNIEIMNDLAENGYGTIHSDGTLSIESNDFIQQSPFMNFHVGWFRMYFRTNYIMTTLFGALGLLINFDNIKDVKSLLNADSSTFEKCFKDVALDLISDGESYFGNLMLDSLTTAVNTVISIKKIVLNSTWLGRLAEILKYIISHYAPGLLKGIAMVLSGIIYQYGTDVEIGLWWSNYSILSYSVY